ncbi:YegP family protein [Dyadobacter sp. 3J3]|uniref:YegP family protein n=1 Tax=Dyadobacter sp. 3J3 TaxID=2606600 RepID=UPI00135CB3BF|nr:YegP family protein [Dyadobacter sp. 3J3]
MANFQVFKSSTKNQFYYLLKATGNSQLILSCEGFTSKQKCLDAIKYIREKAAEDDFYERTSSYLNYIFVVKDANGMVIGKGEHYTIESARENSIEMIKSGSANAVLQDFC